VSDAEPLGRSALVLGATGLVGASLVERMLAGGAYSRVAVLTRRPLPPASDARLETHVVDFDRLGDHRDLFRVRDVYCCLGTTLATAGSREAFRRVDLDYVVGSARLAAEEGASGFLVVSALGADAGSRIFYNRVKGEMEEAVLRLPFRSCWVLRPSLLLGERRERRPGEGVATLLLRPLAPLMLGPLRRYRPIPARDVAAAMLCLAEREGRGVVESEEIAALVHGEGR
jgi:uncharacterized protein YbjT (DUF2867 family)